MTIRLNGSTSGYTEIDAPASAGNNTLVLPSGNGSANQLLKNSGTAGTLAFASAAEDSSGNFAFNSGYGSTATAYGCRAWVRFNSVGTIAGSGNVSSVTVLVTNRDFRINFSTAMPDENYTLAFSGSGVASSYSRDLYFLGSATPTTTSVDLTNSNALTTPPYYGVVVFR